MPVRYRVGEARRSGVVGIGNECDYLRAGVVADGTVDRVADARDRQGIAIGIRVVSEKGRGRNRESGILIRDEAAIVVGYRVAISTRLVEHKIDPIVGPIRGIAVRRKSAGTSVSVNAIATASPVG